jgi:hypothetical protein
MQCSIGDESCIAGPFTVRWLNRPAVYGGLLGQVVQSEPCSQGFSLQWLKARIEKPHKWGYRELFLFVFA